MAVVQGAQVDAGGSRPLASGTQLAMLGVVVALVLVANDRAPDFVRYTLLLVLVYLLLSNAPAVGAAGSALVDSLSAVATGG